MSLASVDASPAVAAQQAVLAKQLSELKQLRHDMQSMYDASQLDVQEAKEETAQALAEAARERDKSDAFMAENVSLRQWNERLAAELKQVLAEHKAQADAEAMSPSAALESGHEGEEVEAAHLLASASAAAAGAASGAPTGVSVDISVLQQCQLEMSATALRLTHAHARLKRRGKELRAAGERNAQLQQTAQALSSDLTSATTQIGKLEQRVRGAAETHRTLEQLKAEYEAQSAALERTNTQLARAREDHAALVKGPLAAAERKVAELDERDRRGRAIVERKVRQATEMAAAVQTLGADSRMRIEENVKLRLLAQRLGATPREIDRMAGGGSGGSSRPPPSPMEALQSQMALQEKLRKVRTQFADIRKSVGVGFEE